MSDYGFKISLPGYDVKTATPEQCSIHSSYDSLKVKLDAKNPQEGNVLVSFQDTPSAGTYEICAIHHGYGYIPAYYFFFDLRSSSNALGAEVGNFFALSESDLVYFQAVPDEQNIIFNFVTDGSEAAAGEFFSFKFYVFANNGV